MSELGVSLGIWNGGGAARCDSAADEARHTITLSSNGQEIVGLREAIAIFDVDVMRSSLECLVEPSTTVRHEQEDSHFPLRSLPKLLGFSRQKATWNRRAGSIVDVIDIQVSEAGDAFTINAESALRSNGAAIVNSNDT